MHQFLYAIFFFIMFPSQYFELQQQHIISPYLDQNKRLQIKYIKHHFYHLFAQANNNRPVCPLSLIQTQRYSFRLQAQADKGLRQLKQMMQRQLLSIVTNCHKEWRTG